MKRILAILMAFLLLSPSAFAIAESQTLTIQKIGMDDRTEYAMEEQKRSELGVMFKKGRYATAIDDLLLLHSGIKIEHQMLGTYGPFDELYASVEKGEPGRDILFLQRADLPSLYRAGLIKDLYTSPLIKEAIADWPDLRSLLGDGEHLFALPEQLSPKLMQVDSLWLRMELDLAIDGRTWTWDDFFDIGDKLYDYNQAHQSSHYLTSSGTWNPHWLDQFFQNECSEPGDLVFDVDALRILLSRWKDMVDKGLVVNPIAHQTSDTPTSLTLFCDTLMFVSLLQEDSVYLPPMYKEGIRRTGVEATLYMVNAKSSNAQEATDFLAYYCRPDAIAASYLFLDNGIFPEGLEPNANYLQGQGSSPYEQATPEAKALWKEAIETGYLNRDTEVLTIAHELNKAFLDGQMSLDECVSQMQERIAKLALE